MGRKTIAARLFNCNGHLHREEGDRLLGKTHLTGDERITSIWGKRDGTKKGTALFSGGGRGAKKTTWRVLVRNLGKGF